MIRQQEQLQMPARLMCSHAHQIINVTMGGCTLSDVRYSGVGVAVSTPGIFTASRFG